MKYLLFFILSGLLIACNNEGTGNANKDSLTKAALSDTSNYTTIEWIDSTEQTIKKITEGQSIEISWRFKNSGDKPLVIADVKGTCGCTGTDFSKEPLMPGKEGVIRATFNSNGMSGLQHKSVTVKANNKNRNAGDHDNLGFMIEVAPKQ